MMAEGEFHASVGRTESGNRGGVGRFQISCQGKINMGKKHLTLDGGMLLFCMSMYDIQISGNHAKTSIILWVSLLMGGELEKRI